MNWGHGILITIIIFVASILGMVVLSSRQSIDMMDEGYYEKELKHQELIDESANFARDNGKVEINDLGKYLEVKIPENLTNDITSGNILMMRPSDKSLDVNIPMQMKSGKQLIDKNLLIKGLYNIRMSWINNGTTYYQTFTYLVS
ncbi:MAG TPA: FixH family protein [Saprospiraceae bacterium]|jgi:hypothetical protein|nr:MAG: FixH family protein [Candidatus Parvibacillus calidus]MBX2936032.1 FixH family protein [Saprospiraceae bacterium]MBK7741486.1 FixH family protein [Candidatus Parvibacillus calidus]MBX7179607.1 FixH family protein [Saprospiraceae bacterium]MCB0590160.1 FixH family protein [Saprospiraceae bacterium]